jgi:hypothetical protein
VLHRLMLTAALAVVVLVGVGCSSNDETADAGTGGEATTTTAPIDPVTAGLACNASAAAMNPNADFMKDTLMADAIQSLESIGNPETLALAEDLKSAANDGAVRAALEGVRDWCTANGLDAP